MDVNAQTVVYAILPGHLRFGEFSVAELYCKAKRLAAGFLQCSNAISGFWKQSLPSPVLFLVPQLPAKKEPGESYACFH
jgi:hypothetical protein